MNQKVTGGAVTLGLLTSGFEDIQARERHHTLYKKEEVFCTP